MKLEDLFVKQRPPKDYVTYPPQEIPTLEKFFAERTNPPAGMQPEPKPTPQVVKEDPVIDFSPSVAEEEVQQIKQQYAPMAAPQIAVPGAAPQEQQFMPQQPLRMPAMMPDRAVDFDSIKEMAEKAAPKSSMSDIIPALVPAAIDLFTGGYGQGLKLGGEYLVGEVGKKEQRRQKLEDMLLALEKSKLSKRGQKGFQLKPLRNRVTGEPVIGNYDPSTATMYGPSGEILSVQEYELAPGLSTPEFARRQNIQLQKEIASAEALGKGGYISPETGLRTVVRGGKAIPIQEQAGVLNPKQVKDLQSTVSKFLSSDAYKKPANSMQAAAAIDELIAKAQSGNPSAAQFARKELAKIAEGGGKLTDQDFEMAGGSPSYRAKAKRFANLQKTDQPLTPQELKDLKEIADILYKASEMKLRQSVTGLEESFIQRGGIKGAVEKEMSAYIPSKPKQKSTIPTFEEWKKMKYGK